MGARANAAVDETADAVGGLTKALVDEAKASWAEAPKMPDGPYFADIDDNGVVNITGADGSAVGSMSLETYEKLRSGAVSR